jgi:hypothetical protein
MAQLSAEQAINNNALLLNRPMSTTGLPSGSMNINGDGSTTPIDYYIEALQNERLLVARVMVHIVDGGSFDAGSYGNGITLDNGMDLFYKRDGIKYKITDSLPIKTNVDWGRWCYDIAVSEFGQGNEALNARWTLTKYGTPYGIILEEGDQLGIRVNDDMSDLIEQTLILEGLHLGTPNSTWATILT